MEDQLKVINHLRAETAIPVEPSGVIDAKPEKVAVETIIARQEPPPDPTGAETVVTADVSSAPRNPGTLYAKSCLPPETADTAAFDLSVWEEETESPPPPSDLSCLAQAGAVQSRISQHVPIDNDEDWDDVDLDLPEILGSGRRRADFDLDEERALRELMTAALRDGGRRESSGLRREHFRPKADLSGGGRHFLSLQQQP